MLDPISRVSTTPFLTPGCRKLLSSTWLGTNKASCQCRPVVSLVFGKHGAGAEPKPAVHDLHGLESLRESATQCMASAWSLLSAPIRLRGFEAQCGLKSLHQAAKTFEASVLLPPRNLRVQNLVTTCQRSWSVTNLLKTLQKLQNSYCFEHRNGTSAQQPRRICNEVEYITSTNFTHVSR